MLRPSFSLPRDDTGAARAEHAPLSSVALPQNPPCRLPQRPRLWQPACPYQLMNFLWVDNKEPLVEPQGCGHTAGIWLQANDICQGKRQC